MKNKIESSTPGRHIEVILVIPLGVEEQIYLWGAHSIRDYLSNTCGSVTIKWLDFRSDTYFEELNNRYRGTLGTLFLSLSPEQIDTFYGAGRNPYIFLGLAAFAGDDFFKITGLGRLSRGTYLKDLRRLKSEMESHILDKMNEYTGKTTDKTRIWAFSVYDFSLFSSLHIARMIKQEDPGSLLILGGDHFNFFAAEETFKHTPFVDGIVVGYGEEVMRCIVSGARDGISLKELRVNGLVNAAYFRDPEEARSPGTVNVPPLYKELSSNPPISYVQRNEAAEIRILSQRGCSWGNCSFCTQIDKNMFFPLSVEHLVQRMEIEINALKSDAKRSPIRISFDSDENEIDMFIQFIDYLDGIENKELSFHIILWLQVKSLRKTLAERLAKLDNKRIRVLLRINFESLNIGTLKYMIKGHLPVQAIEGAKSAQDCGHFFESNYFTHFPMENCDSVAHELELLKRIAHLFMPPKGGGSFFPYASNNRDSLYRNQDKYKIKISRMKGDNWLNHGFGIDLPFSQWSYQYDEKPAFNMDRLVVWSYYKSIKARDAAHGPRKTAQSNWGRVKIPLRVSIAFFSRFLKLYAWKGLHSSLTLIGKGRVFRHRTRLFQYFSKVIGIQKELSDENLESSCKRSLHMVSKNRAVRPSHFFIEDGQLTKDYNTPGDNEKWSISLGDNELEILRYLYWSRKRNKVRETFKDRISEPELIEVIDRHLKLGSLIEFKGILLCVANDPGYWSRLSVKGS